MTMENDRAVAATCLREHRAPVGVGGAAAVAPTDSSEFMGVPEAALTSHMNAAFTQLLDEVDRLRDKLEAARKRVVYLEELADQDALVPVRNRRAFVRELSRMMGYVERYGTPHSILFFDINGMKAINDRYGHAAGDAALTHVARVLIDQVRESDLVGRLGGDEFGVLLAQADPEAAQHKGQALAETIRGAPMVWQGETIHISLAHGAHTLAAGEDVPTALSLADRDMYRQKRQADGIRR